MTVTPIELVPLGTMTLSLRPPLVLDPTPAGARWVVEAESGRIEGERLNATITAHANADWLVVGPGGVGTVDARLVAQTDDGALVYIQYNGRVDLAAGAAAPIYIAPRFEAGDERYRWLNTVQAVGKGSSADMPTLVYELFEVR